MDIFSQLMDPPKPRAAFTAWRLRVVTNNKDPDGLGRVKVKLPWMDEQAESDWARVVSPMAGQRARLLLFARGG